MVAQAQKCNLCEDTVATLFCKQCNEVFCVECFEALHYSGKRQGHDVEPLESAGNVPQGASAQKTASPPSSTGVTRAAAPLSPAPAAPAPSEKIGGVGLFLKPNDKGELEIVRLARGGSAERSGYIFQGDIVMEVDGQDVYKKDFSVFAKLIQGPVGTYVKVKVAKGSDMNKHTEVSLERTLNPEEGQGPPPGQAPPQRASPVFQQPPLGGSMSSAADIGIDFKADETGCFQISGMKPGGPAEASGQVDIGDILYEIDGVKVLYGIGPNGRSLSNIEITEMLRGPEGSILNLRLQKGRMGRLAHVNLTRTSGLAVKAAPPQPAAAQRSMPPPPPEAAPDPPRRSPMAEQPHALRAAAPPDRTPIMPPERGELDSGPKSKPVDTIAAMPPEPPRPPIGNQGPPPPPPAPAPPAPPPAPPSPPASNQVDTYQPPVDTYQPPPPASDGYQQPQQPASQQNQPPLTPLYGTHQSGFSGFGDQQQDPMYDPNMMQQPMGTPDQHMYQQGPQYGAPMGQFPFPYQQMPPPQQQYQPPQPAPIPNIDKSYAENYKPEQPDRFGLGLTLKPYGPGQLRVAEILPGGPAEMSGMDVQVGDWLHHIDMQPVYKQPTAKVISMLQGKMKGDVVRLGLRRPTDREVREREVFIVKGNTGVKLANCGVGIVFKQDFDDFGTGWVRVAQVVPDGPAMKSLGEDIIKVNDRIVEVNGEQVAKQPLHRWVHLLKGPEESSCVLTLGDVNAELYTCNILRGTVEQNKVDPNADKIAPPLIEKPITLQPRKIAPQKKFMVNLYGLTCGISFVTNSEGEVVIDHLNPHGPAAKVEGMAPGDILREIGDGPDAPAKQFPMRDVYKKPVQEWMNVITEGIPEEKVQFTFERMNGSTYEAIVEREVLANVRDGTEELARVGLRLSKHGGTLMVDAVEQGSDAQKVGIQPGYFLLSANNEPMTGDLDSIQERMNEILVAPKAECTTPVELLFNTALGKIKFRVLRDVMLPFKNCRSKPKKNKDQPIPFYNGMLPGDGVPSRPMCNPQLWQSMSAVLSDPHEIPPPDTKTGQPLQDAFIWRGRVLRKPVQQSGGQTVVKDYYTDEIMYWGPGLDEPSLLPPENKPKYTSRVREISQPTRGPGGASVKPMSPPPNQKPSVPPAQPPQPPQPSTPARDEIAGPARIAPPPQQQPVRAALPPPEPEPEVQKPPPEPTPPVKQAPPEAPPAPPAPAAPPAAPASPAAAGPPAVTSADDDDDESTLVLNDGTTCQAAELEAILKKHLPAVAHLMVVGSKRAMLSCMLTLKTAGSEAVEEGKDPREVAEPLKLAAPALELAQKVGSEAKDVKEARQDNKFRTMGLLPGFSAANQEINNSARQVRRFSILMSNFSMVTGELNADGSLARLKIKKQWKSTIDGMYQNKAAPKPAAT